MADGLALLQNRLNLADWAIHARFPCGRTFELELVIDD
jgi:hypothetical protein